MRGETVVWVKDTFGRTQQARCIYQLGALAVTEALWMPLVSTRRDRAWVVTHLPTGGAFRASQPLTAVQAERCVRAMAPLVRWERITTPEQVAALGKRTRARLRALLAKASAAPKKKGGAR